MPPMRSCWLLTGVLMLAGCQQEDVPLPDTLHFPPGTPITFNGAPAKLYGTEQCAQGALAGRSCLVIPPHKPSAQAVVVSGESVQQIEVHARRDPQNPVLFVVEDAKGRALIRTSGHHQELGDMQIAF